MGGLIQTPTLQHRVPGRLGASESLLRSANSDDPRETAANWGRTRHDRTNFEGRQQASKTARTLSPRPITSSARCQQIALRRPLSTGARIADCCRPTAPSQLWPADAPRQAVCCARACRHAGLAGERRDHDGIREVAIHRACQIGTGVFVPYRRIEDGACARSHRPRTGVSSDIKSWPLSLQASQTLPSRSRSVADASVLGHFSFPFSPLPLILLPAARERTRPSLATHSLPA